MKNEYDFFLVIITLNDISLLKLLQIYIGYKIINNFSAHTNF